MVFPVIADVKNLHNIVSYIWHFAYCPYALAYGINNYFTLPIMWQL